MVFHSPLIGQIDFSPFDFPFSILPAPLIYRHSDPPKKIGVIEPQILLAEKMITTTTP
jgi:hypothetical protein